MIKQFQLKLGLLRKTTATRIHTHTLTHTHTQIGRTSTVDTSTKLQFLAFRLSYSQKAE